MHIRPATMQDHASIMDLYYEAADAMANTPYDCCWRRGGHPSPTFVQSLIEQGNMLVAQQQQELIGVVAIDHDLGHDYGDLPWLVNTSADRVAVIHLLVIRQDHRGKGLSRSLLRACMERARTAGMLTARLEATANNRPAIALYTSEGFVQVGTGTIDVGPLENPHVPFVVLEKSLS